MLSFEKEGSMKKVSICLSFLLVFVLFNSLVSAGLCENIGWGNARCSQSKYKCDGTCNREACCADNSERYWFNTRTNYACTSGCYVAPEPTCNTYSFPSWTTVSWSQCNSSGIQTKTVTCPSGSPRCAGSCTAGTTTTTSQSCTYTSNPYFASLLEPNIPLNGPVNKGDTVFLRFPGTNIEGKNITFNIELLNESNTVWYKPYTWFGGNTFWSSFNLIQGEPVQLFTISEQFSHRINSSIESENIYRLSPILSVSDSLNSLNSPIARIDLPIEGLKSSIDFPINFTQSSEDEDDLLQIKWDFGDENNITFYNYSRYLNLTGANTIHQYSHGGYYNVRLTAKEMTRLGQDEDYKTILIFDRGINVIPIISSPENGSSQGYLVRYNASQSYVVNCSESFKGLLPPEEGFDTGIFGCKYILAPGAKEPTSGSVSIRWRELDSDGNELLNGWSRGATVWNETNYNSSVVFPIVHKKPDTRRIRMEMIHSD